MSQSVGVPTLVLWDADHTLIENGGVNKLNYLRAFEGLVGYEAKSQPQTDGRTDIEIMLAGLSRMDFAFTAPATGATK